MEIEYYRFSDEREWRFVPHHEAGCDFLLGSKTSIADDKWKDANEKLSSITLTFEPNDIKYIIIKNDDQISDFINTLRSNKGRHFSLYEIERLTTRILTSEQIMTDV